MHQSGVIDIADNSKFNKNSLNQTKTLKNNQPFDTHDHQNNQQIQQQHLKFSQKEEEAIILYYIYEDCQNFLNLLYSLSAVEEYYKSKKDPNNQMIKLCRNKLITQLNISNSIHFDLQTRLGNQQPKFLNEQKSKLKQKLQDIKQNTLYKCEFELYLKNSLGDNIQINQQKIEDHIIKANFNDKVLQQILPQIQMVDQKVNQIRSNKDYQVPTLDEMKLIAETYKTNTIKKLEGKR